VRWPDHAIWGHVYPLGFLGAEKAEIPDEPRHRLPGLADQLDHLLELGCNGLALGPVFAAETHGYDTVDHFRIDPRLGGDGDFDALIAAAHERGLRVVLGAQAGVDPEVVDGVVAVRLRGEDRAERQSVAAQLEQVVEVVGQLGQPVPRLRDRRLLGAEEAQGIDVPPDGVVGPAHARLPFSAVDEPLQVTGG
jgi:hypothetical protein